MSTHVDNDPGRDGPSLEARLCLLEDELAIRRLLLTYGPAADAGMAELASSVWSDGGLYDWDAVGEPHVGRAAVDAMLRTDGHLGLIGRGAAHFAGPPLISLDGDKATALTYSLIMLRDTDTDALLPVAGECGRDGTSNAEPRRGRSFDGPTGSSTTREAGGCCSATRCTRCSRKRIHEHRTARRARSRSSPAPAPGSGR